MSYTQLRTFCFTCCLWVLLPGIVLSQVWKSDLNTRCPHTSMLWTEGHISIRRSPWWELQQCCSRSFNAKSMCRNQPQESSDWARTPASWYLEVVRKRGVPFCFHKLPFQSLAFLLGQMKKAQPACSRIMFSVGPSRGLEWSAKSIVRV